MFSDEIIEQVIDLQEDGFSYREIADELKKKGIKIGKTTIAKICADPEYGKPEAHIVSSGHTEGTDIERIVDNEDRKLVDSILDSSDEEEPDANYDSFGRTVIQLDGETIYRKVGVSPVTLLQYSFFKKRFGWDGSLSDFFEDVTQFFMDNFVGEDIVIQPNPQM